MEILVYFAITALWWILSFTVLLPFTIALLLSKTVRDKWFSFVYTVCGTPTMFKELQAMRQKLFEHLEEQLSKRDKSVPLKVLEIGIGTGANLEFYPENSHLTVLDMNPSFIQYFNKNKENYPHVKLDGVVIGYAEDMKTILDDSFDLIICTNVLCSVKDIDAALKEVKRVIKPNGKFVFIEHVVFPKSQTEYLLQQFAKPLWATYFNGCSLTRDIGTSIRKARFSDVHYDTRYLSCLPLFVRNQIFGIATK